MRGLTPGLLAETATRDTFAGLETWQIALWYGLIVASVAIFVYGVLRLFLKYRRGRGHEKLGNARERAERVVRVVFTHAWLRRRDSMAGLGHLLVFYGFMVLFAGTVILAFQDDFANPVLSFEFWHGWFYKLYSLFLDVFGAALVVGLTFFAVKPGIPRPARLRT